MAASAANSSIVRALLDDGAHIDKPCLYKDPEQSYVLTSVLSTLFNDDHTLEQNETSKLLSERGANPNYIIPTKVAFDPNYSYTSTNFVLAALRLNFPPFKPLAAWTVVTFLHTGRPDPDHVAEAARLLRKPVGANIPIS